MKFKNKTFAATLLMAVVGNMEANAEATPLHPLSTDRPDTTESPYTVDCGHYQFELEIGSLTRDGGESSYGFGEINAKYGIDDLTDIQFVLPLYNHISGGAEGFGDMQIRVKRNLWGNDGEGTALAVMPFIQIPTGADGISSEEFEGGIIVPFGFEGACGWGYGVQGELDIVANEDGGGHHFSFLISATAAHDLTDDVGAFFEVIAIFSEGADTTSECFSIQG